MVRVIIILLILIEFQLRIDKHKRRLDMSTRDMLPVSTQLSGPCSSKGSQEVPRTFLGSQVSFGSQASFSAANESRETRESRVSFTVSQPLGRQVPRNINVRQLSRRGTLSLNSSRGTPEFKSFIIDESDIERIQDIEVYHLNLVSLELTCRFPRLRDI
jgi:hypothetical protein